MNNDIYFYLSRYLDYYPFLIPLGAIGVWRWSVWLTKKAIGFFYKPKKPGFKTSVSVVTPVYNEEPLTFSRALTSWKKNNPEEIIAVIDYTDEACIKIFKDFARKLNQAKLIVTKRPGKREALEDGIRVAKSEIVALVDSDTIWDKDTLSNGIAPFSDEKIGGVATRQSIEAPKTIAQKLFSIRLEQRYWDEIPFLAKAEDIIVCLSGRTAFYRRGALMPVLNEMVNEKFMGQKVISGEDKRLTYLVDAAGWNTTYQSTARVFTTGVEDISTFIKQQVRWTRNSWRNDLKALFQGWVFKHPVFTMYLIDRAIQPFTLLISPIYFIVSAILGLWIPVVVILVWWHFSRLIKMYPHLRKHPTDIWMLPIFIVFNFVTAYIRLYALFSLNVQGWITRWHKSRMAQIQRLSFLRAHAFTLMVVFAVVSGVSYYRQQMYLIPRQNQKKLITKVLPIKSTLIVSTNPNVLGAATLNPEMFLAKKYEFRADDTLATVAERFDAQFENLLYANVAKITNWNRIKPGTIITVPPKATKLTPNFQFNYQRIYDDVLAIWYDSSTAGIVVSGRGTFANLSVISGRVGKQYLEEVSPKVWYLKTNLFLRSGVTLELDKNEVVWLKMASNKNNFATLRAFNADILINGVKITSWDESKKDYDKNHKDGRSYILVKDGSRMDIVNSEIAYLGYHRPHDLPFSPYGISWRMSTGKLGKFFLTGEVINSKFHHNYFGAYTFGATGMLWRANKFFDNVRYGLDPHDDSNGFLVENNLFHNNGSHGLIFSKRVINNIVRNNTSYNNKLHGIMLHETSNNNIIENNTLYGNTDGVALDHSSNNIIRNNNIFGNKRGIRASKKSLENLVENNKIIGSSQYGVYLYGDSNGNIIRHNSFSKNTNAMYIKSSGNQALNNQVEDNKVGVYFAGRAYDNNLQENKIKYNKVYGVYTKISTDLSNVLGITNSLFRNKEDITAYEVE